MTRHPTDGQVNSEPATVKGAIKEALLWLALSAWMVLTDVTRMLGSFTWSHLRRAIPISIASAVLLLAWGSATADLLVRAREVIPIPPIFRQTEYLMMGNLFQDLVVIALAVVASWAVFWGATALAYRDVRDQRSLWTLFWARPIRTTLLCAMAWLSAYFLWFMGGALTTVVGANIASLTISIDFVGAVVAMLAMLVFVSWVIEVSYRELYFKTGAGKAVQ